MFLTFWNGCGLGTKYKFIVAIRITIWWFLYWSFRTGQSLPSCLRMWSRCARTKTMQRLIQWSNVGRFGETMRLIRLLKKVGLHFLHKHFTFGMRWYKNLTTLVLAGMRYIVITSKLVRKQFSTSGSNNRLSRNVGNRRFKLRRRWRKMLRFLSRDLTFSSRRGHWIFWGLHVTLFCSGWTVFSTHRRVNKFGRRACICWQTFNCIHNNWGCGEILIQSVGNPTRITWLGPDTISCKPLDSLLLISGRWDEFLELRRKVSHVDQLELPFEDGRSVCWFRCRWNVLYRLIASGFTAVFPQSIESICLLGVFHIFRPPKSWVYVACLGPGYVQTVGAQGNPLISGKPRLVKYYNLARLMDFLFGSWLIFLFESFW